MIANCKPISHGKAAAEYDLQKQVGGEGVAHEICRNGLYGLDGSEIVREMQEHQRQSGSRLRSNHYFRIEITPAIEEDAESWTEEMKRETVLDYMKRMGLDNTQFFAVWHDRTDHDLERHGKKLGHIHILANRTDLNGNTISDSYSQKKSIKVAGEMTRERGFKTADEVSKAKRATVRDKALKALGRLERWDFEAFRKECARDGVTVRPNISEKSGKMSGYYLGIDGKEWKASAIGRELTMARIEETHKAERRNHEQQHRQTWHPKR